MRKSRDIKLRTKFHIRGDVIFVSHPSHLHGFELGTIYKRGDYWIPDDILKGYGCPEFASYNSAPAIRLVRTHFEKEGIK